MAIAIITKYLPATETRGARIKVSAPKDAFKSKTCSYEYGADCPHEAAFDEWLDMVNKEMAQKYGTECPLDGWFKLIGKATTHDNTGYIFLIQ